MNFLKKLFGRKKKEIAPNEEEIQKENECWYNDMSEKVRRTAVRRTAQAEARMLPKTV